MTDLFPHDPRSAPSFIDTHVHLDDPVFDQDRAAIIDHARSRGVATMINVGYAPARWESTIALAESHSNVLFTLGLHPGHAEEFSDSLMADLDRQIRASSPSAIGEIGLDYSRPAPNRELQHRAFSAQLELASDSGLPVVIHQRNAGADCAGILAEVSAHQMVVLHSFDGNTTLLKLGLDRGWIFGVGGLMTRPSSRDIRKALTRIPLDQIVLETDAPYLVPAGIKERRNHPGVIPRIADAGAGVLGVSVDELARRTTANARHVFRIQEDGHA